jgi:hypothetical protein
LRQANVQGEETQVRGLLLSFLLPHTLVVQVDARKRKMALGVFRLYNITEFLRALAYFLSNAFAINGSSCSHSFWHKVGRNPMELIAEFPEFRLAGSKSLSSCDVQVADCHHDVKTELRSFLF